MFTNQYFACKKGLFEDSNVKLTVRDGSAYTFPTSSIYNCEIGVCMKKAYCKIPSSSGVYFGAGSTPAQKTDYDLENMITSGLTITNGSFVSTNSGNGVYWYECSYIVRNSSENEITISEIGYYSAADNYAVLMERTVLASPLTIQPGESKLITYKITFNQSVS